MQNFKLLSLPVMLLIICSFFLIAYNAYNQNYEFFFDAKPIEPMGLEIKSEDIVFELTFGQQPEDIMALVPDKKKKEAAGKFKQISFIK